MNKIKLLAILFLFCATMFSQNNDTSRVAPPPPSGADTNYIPAPNNPNTVNPKENNTTNTPVTIDSSDYYKNHPKRPITEPPHQKEKKYPKGYAEYKKSGKAPGTEQPAYVEKLYYGCNIILRFYPSTYGNVFYYDLSPHVGYKINEYFSVGAQVIYNNSILSYGNTSISYNVVGPGVFVRVLLGRMFFLQAEFDELSVPQDYLGTSVATRAWSDEKMVGIGYKRMMGQKLSYYINFMYDINPNYYSPYFGAQLVYRAGLVYNFQ